MKIQDILSVFLGLVLLLMSVLWIFTPKFAAEQLYMDFLEGYGRNTQIRDFTALFLATSIMSFISFFTKQHQWIFCTGLVYFLAAIFNITASFNHEAPIVFSALVSEIIFCSMALTSAFLYKSNKL